MTQGVPLKQQRVANVGEEAQLLSGDRSCEAFHEDHAADMAMMNMPNEASKGQGDGSTR